MIKCLAVDDETYAAEIIADFIKKTPFLELVGTTNSGIDALRIVQQGGVDLVFLDVQMPELTGIQFLKVIGNKCKVILTTAYPDYALEGYELDVVDYLMKPIAFDRFLRAVQKAQALISTSSPVNTAPDIPPPPETSSVKNIAQPTFILLKGDRKNSYIKMELDEICYIEGMRNYVVVHTTGGQIITYHKLVDLEAELQSPPFFRIHKSFIVSLRHIKRIEGNSVKVGDRLLPVSEMYRAAFYTRIQLLG